MIKEKHSTALIFPKLFAATENRVKCLMMYLTRNCPHISTLTKTHTAATLKYPSYAKNRRGRQIG